MTKPTINDTALCKEMARRLLKISLIPAVKNILHLINLPAHVPHTHGEDSQIHPLLELELDQTITAYSDDIDAAALKIDASIRRKHAESTDDFLVRSACLLSNLFNAYIIPTYLVHTLEKVGTYGMLPMPVWSSMIHVSYSVHEGNLVVHKHILHTDQLLLLDSETVDGRKTEFFVAAGEYLRQQIADIITAMEPRRPSKLVLSVLLAPEFITAETVKRVEASVPALETLSRALQLVPIYRSLLSASTNDYGITYAPYYLGVGCASINYVEMCSHPLKQNLRPVKRHKLQACIYLYGVQEHTIPMESFGIATHHTKMSMLSLYEIALEKDKAPVLAEAILHFDCSSKREIRHSTTLAPFFHARDMKIPSSSVHDNHCTVLDVRINPARAAGKRSSARMLSSYLHLIVDSSKNLFGIEHKALVYVETVQDMGNSKNVTVLHVLEIGTPPKKDTTTYTVCESAALIAYDEASYNAQQRPQTQSTTKNSICAVASVLEAIFSSANKKFSEGVLDALTRSAGFATNVDAFLSTGTARCTIIIQDAQHTIFRPPALYEEIDSASDSVGTPSSAALLHSPLMFRNTESLKSEDRPNTSVASTENVGSSQHTDAAWGLIPIVDDQPIYVNCESSVPSTSPFSSPSLPRAIAISRPHATARRRCLSAGTVALNHAAQQIIENEVSAAQQSCDTAQDAETSAPEEPVVASCAKQHDTAPEPASTPVTTPTSMSYLQISPDDAAIQNYNRVRAVPRKKSCGFAFATLLSCVVLLSLTTASYAFFCRKVLDIAIVQRCDAIFAAGISSALVLLIAVATVVDHSWNRASGQLVDTITERAKSANPSYGISSPVSSASAAQGMSLAR